MTDRADTPGTAPTVADLERYRQQARAWIAENLEKLDAPAGIRVVDYYTPDVMAANRALQRRMFDAGYAGISWPREYGGQGLDRAYEAVFNAEAAGFATPDFGVLGGTTSSACVPTMLAHADPHFLRTFVPKVLSGEILVCQFFSEPDAGSDLAGIRTRATRDGERWILNGQKVWSTFAHLADWGLCLARTDWDVPKHAGLTWFAVPCDAPGLTIRPIRQVNEAAEFCEDFFDGVRAPLFNVIGGLNNGWRVAMTTLTNERGGRATVQHLGYEREYWELIETARKYGKNTAPLVRQQLAWAYTQVQLMKFSGLRTMARLAAGMPPGPEASVAKLFWSEYHKKLGEIAAGIEGTDMLIRPTGGTDGDYVTDQWQNVFLSSRAGTIFSGTSEIQRNITGERVLGLPKEPRVA